LVEQLPQHRHEDVDGVGRLSFRVAEQAAVGRAHRRVVRAVHLRAAVDEIHEGTGAHEWGEIFTISLAFMRLRRRPAWARTATKRVLGAFGALALSLSSVVLMAGCSAGSGLFRQYEYEEELYLTLDGTATVYVNSSIAALDALRGTTFDTSPTTPVDRDAVRA